MLSLYTSATCCSLQTPAAVLLVKLRYCYCAQLMCISEWWVLLPCAAAGKTQSINHYLVNRSWYLVDCPGYGEACC
jgi:hypothetical protein